MSEENTVDRVFRRIEQDVERILDREPSSRGVLNQVIQEGAPYVHGLQDAWSCPFG